MIRYDPTFYLDESGDLGNNFNNPKTSHYFVVAIVFTLFPAQINKLVQKVFHNLKKSDIKRNNGVLHSYKEKISTRRRMLRSIADSNTTIFILRIDKRKLLSDNKLAKSDLYNAFVCALTEKLLNNQSLSRGMTFRIVANEQVSKCRIYQQFIKCHWQ